MSQTLIILSKQVSIKMCYLECYSFENILLILICFLFKGALWGIVIGAVVLACILVCVISCIVLVCCLKKEETKPENREQVWTSDTENVNGLPAYYSERKLNAPPFTSTQELGNQFTVKPIKA